MKTTYPNALLSPPTIVVNSNPVGTYTSLGAWLQASKEAVQAQVEDNPPLVGDALTSSWRTSSGEAGDNPRTVVCVREEGEAPAALVDRQFDLVGVDMRTYPPG